MNTHYSGFERHTSSGYNQELEDLRSQLLKMGGLVETQLKMALEVLESRSLAQAQVLLDMGDEVDQMEVDLDQDCAKVIARRQPAASDLRLIIAVMKSTRDTERMGDQTEKVIRTVTGLLETDFQTPYLKEMIHLGQQVLTQVSAALNALARLDAESAVKLTIRDQSIDAHHDQLCEHILIEMAHSPQLVKPLMQLILCAQAFERIGDHAKNICEHIIYLVTGKDVRHVDMETINPLL